MEENETGTHKSAGSSYFSRMLTRIGGVFLAPEATFRQITSENIGIWEPLMFVLLLVGIHAAVVSSFFYRIVVAVADSLSPLTGAASLGFVSVVTAIVFVVTIVSVLVLWPIVAVVAHLSAIYVFKGQGSVFQLIKLYGYTMMPSVLQILGMVLMGMNWTLWPFTVFLNVMAAFWIVVLMSVAVRHNYNIDMGKAFISSFIGPLTLWLIVIMIVWAWVWLAISSFAGGAA